jgi:hypothetical protein
MKALWLNARELLGLRVGLPSIISPVIGGRCLWAVAPTGGTLSALASRLGLGGVNDLATQCWIVGRRLFARRGLPLIARIGVP